MTKNKWPFDVPPNASVVTTSYVTQRHMPVLYVSHELDEEGDLTWQFHCGNGDFSAAVLQLVRLDEILRLDASLTELAELQIGYCARRSAVGARWITQKERAE